MNEQIKFATLEECGVVMYSGQIMSRLTLGEASGKEVVAVRKVVVPKCIHADGSVDPDEMPEEQPVNMEANKTIPQFTEADAPHPEQQPDPEPEFTPDPEPADNPQDDRLPWEKDEQAADQDENLDLFNA